ncbi:hypothetical protein EYZ11_012956 [Aspergillus tanneri]|uniref:Uncharacterized protein n=1 Tax=Aspergillus tanneri TaxID=1220188 RepID=A0A4S3IYW6_9EURO|nr:hypothetical protein EYZ11_012956 [Aspergillus tanneri]
MAIPPVGDPENTPKTPENSARNNDEPSLAPAQRARTRRTHTQNTAIPPLDFNVPDDTSNRVTNQMVWALIINLKKTIAHQNITIESTRAEIQEIKTGQQDLQNENAKLRYRPFDPKSNTAPTLDEDIDNDRFTRFLPTEAANTHIRAALLNAEPTKEVQVAGIGATKTGYIIRFRDAQSAEVARNNTEWLEDLGNGTKVVRPRFGIVVHRVPTEDFDLEGNKRKGIEKIMEENELTGRGFLVEDIAWLKKKDRPLGRSASMGIWLNSPEAAEWIINNGLLVGQRYIGSVELYRVDQKSVDIARANMTSATVSQE